MVRTRKTRKRINTGHVTTAPYERDPHPAPIQEALRLDGYQEPGDHVRAIRRLYAELRWQRMVSKICDTSTIREPFAHLNNLRESFPHGELEETQKRIWWTREVAGEVVESGLVAKRRAMVREWHRREEKRTGIYLRDELEKTKTLPPSERDARQTELEAIRLERERRIPRSYKYPVRERYHVPGCEYPEGVCSRDCETIKNFRRRAKWEARYLRLKPAGTLIPEQVEWLVRIQHGEKALDLAKEIVATELAAEGRPTRVYNDDRLDKNKLLVDAYLEGKRKERILTVVRDIKFAIKRISKVVRVKTVPEDPQRKIQSPANSG